MTINARTVRQFVVSAWLLTLLPAAASAQQADGEGRMFAVSAFTFLPAQSDVATGSKPSSEKSPTAIAKEAAPIVPSKNDALGKNKLAAEQAAVKLPNLKSLAEISLNVTAAEAPEDLYDQRNDFHYGGQSQATLKPFCWVAPGTLHNPLYFEDVALERYGQGCRPCLQPAVSGFRFFADTLLLPYQMGLDCPCELEYVLGYRRPGSYAPPVEKTLPWSWKGALMEAGVVVGGLSMFPL